MDSSGVVFYSVHSWTTRLGNQSLYYQANYFPDINVIFNRLIRQDHVYDSGLESYLVIL